MTDRPEDTVPRWPAQTFDNPFEDGHSGGDRADAGGTMYEGGAENATDSPADSSGANAATPDADAGATVAADATETASAASAPVDENTQIRRIHRTYPHDARLDGDSQDETTTVLSVSSSSASAASTPPAPSHSAASAWESLTPGTGTYSPDAAAQPVTWDNRPVSAYGETSQSYTATTPAASEAAQPTTDLPAPDAASVAGPALDNSAAGGAPTQTPPVAANAAPLPAPSPNSAPTPLPAPQGQPYGQWENWQATDRNGRPGVSGDQGVQGSSAFAAAGASSGSGAAPSQGNSERKGPGWLALGTAMVVTALVTVGTTLAVVGGGGVGEGARGGGASPAEATSHTVPKVDATGKTADWQAVAAAVSPAVVTINVATDSAAGVGSGVIYDAEGNIVTNYHVIASAIGAKEAISVTLADGRIYKADIVGHDKTTDLAVIRLVDAPNDLTVGTFGTSAELKVGQQVMAIGSPLGLSNTVTTGIISALDRPVEVATEGGEEPSPNQQSPNNPEDPFGQLPEGGNSQKAPAMSDSVITNAIQVDASINPGNSGGPLFDASGSVIGINSSIASLNDRVSASQVSGSIGLGFAIPADLVVSVVKDLIADGTVDHAALGVTIATDAVTANGVTKAGARVETVSPGGAADTAGLKAGDVIVAVDGNEVSSSKALSGFIRRYTVGSEVTVTFIRDGKSQEVKAKLQAAAQ
ncbi:MAG: trypsin-like peptidase domain-containing protein [Actinomycetaceae bacterium]|nr:trypsin-like peptidase domain-containing protein [Actinomycetaceae bacterium]